MNRLKILFYGLILSSAFLVFIALSGCANEVDNFVSWSPKEVVFGDSNPKDDFGTIPMSEGKIAVIYNLKNQTDREITVKNIKTSCMCTEVFFEGGTFGMHDSYMISEVFKPEEIKSLKVVFDPLAHGPGAVGPITREVRIYSKDPEYPETKIVFEGNVIK